MIKKDRSEYMKKWKENNKDKVEHYKRVAKLKDPSGLRMKNYYLKNKESLLTKAKIYRDNNKDKIKGKDSERNKTWRQNNKDKVTLANSYYCRVLTDGYVFNMLRKSGLRKDQITPSRIIKKREQTIAKRIRLAEKK